MRHVSQRSSGNNYGTVALDRGVSLDVASYLRTKTEFTLIEPGLCPLLSAHNPRFEFSPGVSPVVRGNDQGTARPEGSGGALPTVSLDRSRRVQNAPAQRVEVLLLRGGQ